MPAMSKKHLPFSAWPPEDRALWAHTFEPNAFDDEGKTLHLASPTVTGLRTSHARYLGFLSNHDPARLQVAAQARIDPVPIKAFVAHLRESCRDTSVASLLHMLRLTLGFLFPERNWFWLKTIEKRIKAGAIPRGDSTKDITSVELYAVGIELMATAEAALVSSSEPTLEDALLYRDGLIIALLAVAPLRRRTLAALTVSHHLVKTGDRWLLDIPAADTKTGCPLEFPLSDVLSEYIDVYLACFRDVIPGAKRHDGLWASTRGRRMHSGSIYAAVRRHTEAALGLPVNLHRFRLAAGNFWSIAERECVRGQRSARPH